MLTNKSLKFPTPYRSLIVPTNKTMRLIMFTIFPNKVFPVVMVVVFIILFLMVIYVLKTLIRKALDNPVSCAGLVRADIVDTSISFSKKLAIFQHLAKVGCCLLTESTAAI